MTVARYFDGQSAEGRTLEAQFTPERLELLDAENRTVKAWALRDLWRSAGQVADDRLVLVPKDAPESRVIIDNPTLEYLIRQRIADLRRGPQSRNWKGRLGLVAAFVAVCGFFIFYGVPNLAALGVHLIPKETERRIGEVVAEAVPYMFSGKPARYCKSREGRAALDRLLARLSLGPSSGLDLKVRVVQVPIANAFAAPGGHIVVFSGLLDDANEPDSIAGILAHEVGHVIKRHALRRWLRERGTTGFVDVLIGGVPGASVLTSVADVALGSSYSRADEAEADAIALDLLAKAGISTKGLADFFDSIRGQGDGATGAWWLSSHPPTEERGNRARAVTVPNATPALDAADWQALKAICR